MQPLHNQITVTKEISLQHMAQSLQLHPYGFHRGVCWATSQPSTRDALGTLSLIDAPCQFSLRGLLPRWFHGNFRTFSSSSSHYQRWVCPERRSTGSLAVPPCLAEGPHTSVCILVIFAFLWGGKCYGAQWWASYMTSLQQWEVQAHVS